MQDTGKRRDVGANKPVSGEKSETEVQAQNPSCVVFLLGVPAFSVPGLLLQQGVLGGCFQVVGGA